MTTSPNAPFPTTTPRRVLVAGATGYVGGRLIPDLLAAGHHVTALARDPRKLEGRHFVDDPGLVVLQADVLEPSSLAGDLDDIDVAYYLVHSMRAGAGFEDADLRAARNFGQACADAKVQQIVYLSGLGAREDELSSHLQSRHDTGDALREAGVPVTELRAAIIVGSGSASFDIIHDIVARLPVMVTPRWVQSLCEPIAIRDVTWYLVSVLDEPRAIGEILEIGSGDVMAYKDLLRICAEELGLPIRNLSVPVLTPGLSARWLHLVTDVDYALARPLVEGLRNDVICTDLRIREWLPRELSPYRDAVRRALAKRQHPTVRESRWTDARRIQTRDRLPRIGSTNERNRLMGMRIAPERREFRDYRTFDTDMSPRELFRRVSSIGGPGGYGIRAEALWQLRGAIDRVTGGPGLRRGRPFGRSLHPGDALDFWRVEEVEPDERLVLVAEMRAPGDARLEFRVEPLAEGGARLHQLATLSNDTLWSGLYWYAIAPLHDWVFDQLGAHVIENAKSNQRDVVGS